MAIITGRRTMAAALAVAAILATTGMNAGSATVGAQPSPLEQPNILLIVTDDQRLETMSAMPAVRKYFGAGGTEFTRAYATTPLCCPSRGSIFTGRYMHNHDVEANADDAIASLDQSTTMQYSLQGAGYRTGIFGKYFNPWPLTMDPPYFDRWAITNWMYTNSRFNVQGSKKRIPGYGTTFIADQAAKFLEQSSGRDAPWFAYVAPTAPHAPYEPEKKYRRAPVSRWTGNPAVREVDRSDKPASVQDTSVTPKEGRYIRRQQLRTLMTVDDMVARFMRILERSGEADNTIAVFMSDNGYFWGEHGLKDKRLPYLPSIQIPMYMRWPGMVPAGATDDRIAANIDVAPTLLDAAGVPVTHSVDGQSLLLPWDRDRLLIEYAQDRPPLDLVPAWAGLVTRQYQYVEYYNEPASRTFREYYDLLNDPWQLENLLGDGDPSTGPSPAEAESLSAQLVLDRRCSGAECP
jgi:arylsulfatase A-like enzyme